MHRPLLQLFGFSAASADDAAARDDRARSAVTYVAKPDNPDYLGPASLGEIAAQVREATGPSGPNREYVVRLAGALRDIGAEDEHVFGVEDAVTSEPQIERGCTRWSGRRFAPATEAFSEPTQAKSSGARARAKHAIGKTFPVLTTSRWPPPRL